MGVIRRGDSRYWYVQFQFQGQTFIRSAKTTDKRVAEQLEREWRRELHARAFLGKRERITIVDAITAFCRTKAGTPNHRNLSIQAGHLDRLFRTTRYLDAVTSEDIERLKRDREREGAGPASIRHLMNLLRASWKHAKRLGYHVSDLDFPAIKIPKHRLRYLTSTEERRLLAELDPCRHVKGLAPYADRHPRLVQAMWDAYDLVILLLDTGARYSEIAGLEWRQIDLEARTLHLWRPKVQNESVLYLTDRAHEVLRRRADFSASQRFVFLNRKGGKRGYASQAIRKAIHRAGLEGVTIHTLRHTHATRLVQNGLSVYEIKEVLGHADVKTTMRYAHLEQQAVLARARDVIDRVNASASSEHQAATER
jgi:integrase